MWALTLPSACGILSITIKLGFLKQQGRLARVECTLLLTTSSKTNANTPLEEKKSRSIDFDSKELEQQTGEFYNLWKETRQWSIDLMESVYRWAVSLLINGFGNPKSTLFCRMGQKTLFRRKNCKFPKERSGMISPMKIWASVFFLSPTEMACTLRKILSWLVASLNSTILHCAW